MFDKGKEILSDPSCFPAPFFHGMTLTKRSDMNSEMIEFKSCWCLEHCCTEKSKVCSRNGERCISGASISPTEGQPHSAVLSFAGQEPFVWAFGTGHSLAPTKRDLDPFHVFEFCWTSARVCGKESL